MTLSISDLEFTTELPEIPDAVDVPIVEPVSMEQRRRTVDTLTERLSLGRLQKAELIDSVVFAGERGEIEYFPASGAVWARDAAAEAAHHNEMRTWRGLDRIRSEDGQTVFGLDRDTSGTAIREAMDLVEAAGFRDDHQDRPRITLDQVAELDERGETIQEGAGTATVAIDYTFGGLPVFGAGAKTRVYLEPDRRGVRPVGAFHCWRAVVDTRSIAMGDIKEALGAGVLEDPELSLYKERGSRVEITGIDFGLLALPAMVRQGSLMPVFQIQGRVSLPDSRLEHFEFARYHHAVSPERYSRARLFDHHLAVMN